MIIGYTQGTFDMFHVGHLNLIKSAAELCDYLIVGVNSDRLVKEYKNKTPIINQNDRISIVSELRSVDKVILTESLDKKIVLKKYNFDRIFVGDDWKNNERWQNTEKEMRKLGVELIWVPYTKGISSTILRKKLIE